MEIFAASAIVDPISRAALEASGCPKCGCKRCYVVVHTADAGSFFKCTNPKCYVAFQVLPDAH